MQKKCYDVDFLPLSFNLIIALIWSSSFDVHEAWYQSYAMKDTSLHLSV